MHDSKLIQVVQKFDNRQFARWYKFVSSSFSTENKYLLRLFAYLKEYAPDFSHPALAMEAAFPHIFTEMNKLNIPKFRQVLTHAFQLTEDFLKHDLQSPEDISQSLALMDFYLENGLNEWGEKLYEKIKSEVASGLESADKYKKLADLERLSLVIAVKNQKVVDQHKIHDLTFLYEVYSVKETLFLYSSILSGSQSLNIIRPPEHIESYLLWLENRNDLQQIPLVRIYYLITCIRFYRHTINHPSFEAAFTLIKQHQDAFDVKEVYGLYRQLTSYLNHFTTKGDISVYKPLLAIYRELIEQKIILKVDTFIPSGVFYGIVLAGLRCGEFEWVRVFIENERYNVAKSEIDFVYNRSMALLAFYEKDYQAVIPLIHKTENNKDIFTNYNSRRLLLKTYYRLGEMDVLVDNLNTFRVFLTRETTLSKEFVASSRNFASILNKLATLPQGGKITQKKLLKLKQEVMEMPDLLERAWFIEVLDEMMESCKE